ncbi:unnamed protein product [Enterobius vermicularis]|uniref:Dihydropyrimidinase n=1 Tax=Enterobius vermicularis TaxID=51028 RepID=A0A0N4VH82_ENTVE|nr:unnamed protein product [Enterobius vermicularis]
MELVSKEFIDIVLPVKKETPIGAYKQWREWADPKVCCDCSLTVGITSYNNKTAEEMAKLVEPKYGINSFKFFLAYSDYMLNDGEFYHAMLHCTQLGALARVHAENGLVIIEKQKELLRHGVIGPEGHTQSRPEELEAEATNRACILASLANCPLYIVHVMSKGAALAIARHRQKGAVVFGESIAAGLAADKLLNNQVLETEKFLDGSHYYNEDWAHAAAHVMSPPLSRDPGQLHLTATDNCTFTKAQKEAGREDFLKIPNGVNGIEDRMSVVWEKGVYTGKIDPMRFVSIMSSMAAKIFNIYPQKIRFIIIGTEQAIQAMKEIFYYKGRIAPGSDADVIIWNPDRTRVISSSTHHQAYDFNIFEGMEVHDVCEMTISRGKVVWENGKLNTVKGSGKFVPLPPFSPYCFAVMPQRAQMSAPRSVERTISDTSYVDNDQI